ncbi:MAG: CocE/NonD family hydrolase [Alphaproteobacteria bacterium]|nr:CocE/NonD family hydrolase [Alphaproteobacteria bacterium]
MPPIVDPLTGARCSQMMVMMRDGVRLNTFVFLPADGGPRYPVLVHRTPYGIASADAGDKFDIAKAWLPNPAEPMRGSILRGWRAIVEHGYAAVYQDCRGRHGSEGEDRVYADDAADGYDTLDWIAAQPWSNQRVGMSGSSAGATTTLAAASTRHPSLRAFFAQAGGSSIYDDVVCEGQSIEMERLWLWVSKNIPGLSASHRDAVMRRFGIGAKDLAAAAERAAARWTRLDAARHANPPYVDAPEWMHLPLTGYPDFAIWQPFLDEIITHPAPDDFRRRHNFRATIDVPGFHVTSWFDIFQTSVIAAYQDIQARTGTQKLWIGPNEHYFVYVSNFWPRDPYFDWFGYWLKDEPSDLVAEPAVYYSPRAWAGDRAAYVPNDWQRAERWPPPGVVPRRLYLNGDGVLGDAGGAARSYVYDPRRPVPSYGGRNMLIDPGPLDQQPARAAPNYGLTYRGPILDRDLTIAGSVRASLRVQSDCPDTDFIAKLIEGRPHGEARLLMDGVVRAMYREPNAGPQPLSPDIVYQVTIDLGDICHTFAAGSRIELDVTSSNFPRRARNTNSGNAVLARDDDAAIRIAYNTVHHDAAAPSFLELPVMSSRGMP